MSELEGIAIIGMHGRFPGAESVEEFWQNLVAGRDTVSFFSDEELARAGLDVDRLRKEGNYVPARGVLRDADCFDREFFGIHPKEAEVMDPQHRVFLEGCWEALERAGYAPGRINVPVGIYCGATFNTYYLQELHHRPELMQLVGREQVMFGNEKDYIATRAAYKLNLNGPAISLDTACSSSLTAICQACQSLLTYQCDMAIAGGVSVTVPQERGYLFQEGNIGSPDGRTRTFDANAQGTTFSNGLALLVLKRVDEAVADGDQIFGVIRGFALNNDGADRVSFTAPGIQGQAEVIALAQAMAGVEPEDVTYIESHGTATPVGDPIEVAALTDAFRRGTSRKQFCGLGSVKSNVGHLDAASGATGLIKTALSLHHAQIPASLHFESPNPKLDLENSPFYVNSTLKDWTTDRGKPRCAGVSSFGTGGTNAHVVVQQAPPVATDGPSRRQQLLLLSAKTPDALDRMRVRLADHLQQNPGLLLSDVAYTLQIGRTEFAHRQYVACDNIETACEQLRNPKSPRSGHGMQEHNDPPIVFMFPGQGAQFSGMGRELYGQEDVFRDVVDQCARLLLPSLGEDLRHILFPLEHEEELASEKVRQTRFTQPALFVIEYAMAMLWMSWGVRPTAMIGHSVGEFVAACLAGVMSLEDALTLIARRAQLVQSMPDGSMLSVRAAESDVLPLLNGELAIAAVNSPSLCVVSGTHAAVDQLELVLAERGIVAKRLRTSHAFHSQMMDPVVAPFTEVLRSVSLAAPQIPYVSNVTAQWIQPDQATSPEYWATHVRDAVRFSDGVQQLFKDSGHVLLEVGPGSGLTQLALQHPARNKSQRVVTSMPYDEEPGGPGIFSALGALWLSGVAIDWQQFYANQRRRRVTLPTYPFARTRCWPTSPSKAHTSEQRLADAQPNATNDANDDHATGSTDSPGTSLGVVAAACEKSSSGRSAVSPPRKTRLISEVSSLLEELSGIDLSHADVQASLFEFGLDSLLLTQVATLLQSRYQTKVTFRQLMQELTSIDAIADYLDKALPEEKNAAESVSPAVAAGSMAVPDSAVATFLPSGQQVAIGGITSDSQDYLGLLEQHVATTSHLVQQLRRQAAATPGSLEVRQQGKPGIKVSGQGESSQVSHGPYRPLDRSRAHTLSDEQKTRLEQFIARYTAKTATSKKLASENRALLADPRSVAGFKGVWKEAVYAIHTVRSEGSRVWDVDGNEYVDFVMGFGASLLGHRPPVVVEAVKKQLDAGFETGPIHPMAGEVARLVQELTGAERVGFCSSGSEAVLAAIRVSRTVTARDKIVIFEGAYHGIFDEVLARPVVRNGELHCMPTAPGIPHGTFGEIIVLKYGSQESLEIIERYGDDIAAVLVEPVQARRLDLVPREFLQQLRVITEATGTALVFDEVVTGFRLEPGGAQAYFGIRADLATYGKVVGGGVPIGVVTGRAKFMDALDGGPWQYGDDSAPEVGVTFFAGTFVRHPLALAAAKGVLTKLKGEGPGLQQRVAQKANAVAVEFRKLFDKYRAPYHLSHFSSLVYVSVPPEFTYGGLLFYHLRERGIHIFENRLFIFSTEHTDDDCQKLLTAMQSSLEEMQREGFLPRAGEEMDERLPITAAKPAKLADGQIPLTAAQEEIWLAASMSDDLNCSYNQPLRLQFSGHLNIGAMRTALTQLVARHDALRIVVAADGQSQRVVSSLTLDVPLHDLTELSLEEQHAAWERLRDNEGLTPFDLQQGPLVRACIVQLAADRYELFLTAHHIVADGYSCGVLVHDLGKMYSAACENRVAKLDDATSFVDYAMAESTRVDSVETKETERFWLERLDNPPPVVSLPSDKPRPEYKTFSAERISRDLDAEVVRAIASAAAKHGCSVFAWLFGAFTAYLERLSGQDDFVVAIVAADQAMTGQHNLVGHTANLLPIRVSVDRHQPFKQHVTNAKIQLLEAFDRKDITFGTLLKKLRVVRDPSRPPLVSIVLNMDPDHAGASFSGLATKIGTNPRRFENFDWFFNIIRGYDRMELECTFNTDVFTADSIADRLQQFELFIRGLIAGADQLGQVPLIAGESCDRMFVEWNATDMPLPLDKTVQELFVAQAKRRPDEIAVEGHGQSLTYRELDEQSNRLANCLIAKGVAPGALVALCSERSPEMLVGLLGILKTGAAYVPIDPNFPLDRIQYMLHDSEATVAVAHRAYRRLVESRDREIVELDHGSDSGPAAWPDSCPDVIPTAGKLAYVIYTSGSTGRPKGVKISQRAFVNFLCSMQQQPGMTPEDVLLAVTTLSFDIAGLELFLPILAGGRVVIASAEEAADGQKLVSLVKEHGVTIMQATPVTWRMMISSGWKGLSTLKVLCGGEAFPRDLLHPLLDRCSELWNMYGPTETTVWSSVERLSRDSGTISIGRPIANTQLYIMDEWHQPMPVGVPGELFIGGEGLADEYLHRPELTQEKFIDNPLSDRLRRGNRLYRTGDTARYLADGRIECLGRMDNQVKIRGYRIELGEIEAVLLTQPNVQDSAVIAKDFAPGDSRLVAYVVLADGDLLDVASLVAALQEKLPKYMVPALFVELDRLPRTPNNKVDRNALMRLDVDTTQAHDDYQAPIDQIELQLVRLWEQLLGVSKVGTNDDFFRLGGHSLLGVQLVSEIEKVYGKRLPLATLLQARTIAGLATILRSENWQPQWNCLVPLRAGGARPPLFLVHAAGGNVLIYDDLARNLADDLPVYGIQALGLDGGHELPATVEEMAKTYLEEILKLQPSGPYLLAGYCLGGTIALEIATQLFDLGEHVAFLGMLDAHNWANVTPPSLAGRWVRSFQNLNFHVQNYWRLRREDKRMFVQGKMRELKRRQEVWRDTIVPSSRSASQVRNVDRSLAALWANNDRIAEHYRPRAYPGRITYLCPALNYPELNGAEVGWKTIAQGGVEQKKLRVYPAGMLMEPYVQELALEIDRAITNGLLFEDSSANVGSSMRSKRRDVAMR